MKRADFKPPARNLQAIVCEAHFLAQWIEVLSRRALKLGKKTLLLGSVPTVQPQYHALGIQQKTSKFGLSTDAANR